MDKKFDDDWNELRELIVTHATASSNMLGGAKTEHDKKAKFSKIQQIVDYYAKSYSDQFLKPITAVTSCFCSLF